VDAKAALKRPARRASRSLALARAVGTLERVARRSHPLLHTVARVEARREIRDSLGDLEREIGPTPRVFAYPGGGVDTGVATVLEEEGFELAFLTRRGLNALSRPDWLRLRRINVGRSSGLTGIRLQLLPQWARIQLAKESKVHVFLTGPGWGRRTQRARLGAQLGVSSGPLPQRLISDGREDHP
jgi:peptidoglycan/xylan/chitin deacetylase (PgdA/CDA1 family)